MDVMQADSSDPVPMPGAVKSQTKIIKQKKKSAVVTDSELIQM